MSKRILLLTIYLAISIWFANPDKANAGAEFASSTATNNSSAISGLYWGQAVYIPTGITNISSVQLNMSSGGIETVLQIYGSSNYSTLLGTATSTSYNSPYGSTTAPGTVFTFSPQITVSAGQTIYLRPQQSGGTISSWYRSNTNP